MNITHRLIRRHFLLGIGMILIIIMLLAIPLYNHLAKDNKEETLRATPTTASTIANTRRVFIKDFSFVDPEIAKRTENALYGYTLKSNGNIPDLFTGVIRSESYSSSKINDINSMTFLVDVDPVAVTYSVTINKMSNDFSVAIHCAPKEKQMRKDAFCKNLDGIT